jgi:hypothetical protein
MGKAKIEAIKKRLQAIKTPVYEYNEEGKLKRMILPATSVGSINIEIVRRSDEVHTKKDRI